MASELIGVAELNRKLDLLASPQKRASILKASVRTPLNRTMKLARANISRISPGKTPIHRTYKGRLVGAGFASRNIRVKVIMSRNKQRAIALLGVRPEAFYALQFFELGTATIPKQPWLVPAFEASRSSMLSGLSGVLRKHILKIAMGRG